MVWRHGRDDAALASGEPGASPSQDAPMGLEDNAALGLGSQTGLARKKHRCLRLGMSSPQSAASRATSDDRGKSSKRLKTIFGPRSLSPESVVAELVPPAGDKAQHKLDHADTPVEPSVRHAPLGFEDDAALGLGSQTGLSRKKKFSLRLGMSSL